MVREVRTAEELAGLDGLAMPGGESTVRPLTPPPGGQHFSAIGGR